MKNLFFNTRTTHGYRLATKLLLLAVFFVFLGACKHNDPKKNWNYVTTFSLEGINPIGLAYNTEGIWLSDGDHNRLVLINDSGESLKTIDSLDRPMHITGNKGMLLVPQYGNDEVLQVNNGTRNVLIANNEWDAPAGVAAFEGEWAVADFYNHRVVYFNGKSNVVIGKEGKAQGEFYYPTDVQITETQIWVADAYNNRVQVFDKNGQFLQSIGESQKINAATGIFVSKVQLFVTDFENDRVLIFNHQGNLIQELNESINKPTDVLIVDDILYITNYRTGELLKYQ